MLKTNGNPRKMISTVPEFHREQLIIRQIKGPGQFNLQLNMEQEDQSNKKGRNLILIMATPVLSKTTENAGFEILVKVYYGFL